jgi:hypothetical protein
MSAPLLVFDKEDQNMEPDNTQQQHVGASSGIVEQQFRATPDEQQFRATPVEQQLHATPDEQLFRATPEEQQLRVAPDQQRFHFEHTYVQPAPTGGHVRLPEFWVSDPHMWFAQAEAAFRRAGVMASIIRYDYVLIKLPEEVLRSVCDLV